MEMKEENISDLEDIPSPTDNSILITEKFPQSQDTTAPAQDFPECFEVNELKSEPFRGFPEVSLSDSVVEDDEEMQEGVFGDLPYVNQNEGEQLDRLEIETLLKKNDSSIEFRKPTSIRNPKIWSTFILIFHNGCRQNFAKCLRCQSVVTCKKRSGTGSLSRHRCSSSRQQEMKTIMKTMMLNKPLPINIPPPTNGRRTAASRPPARASALRAAANLPVKVSITPTPNSFVHMTMIPLLPKMIPEHVTKDLLEAQVKFLSNGMISSNILSDPNFLELSQKILTIGEKYGQHRVYDIFSQTMVESEIENQCLKVKESLKEVIYDFSISHCVWKSKDQEFVTVYGYYLKENFSFQTVVLGTKLCSSLMSVLPIVEGLVGEFTTKLHETNSDHYRIKCIGTNLLQDELNKTLKNHPCIIQLISTMIYSVYWDSAEYLKSILHSFDPIHPLKEVAETSTDIMQHLLFLQDFVEGTSENNRLIDVNLRKLNVLFGPLMESISRLGKEKRSSASEVFLWYRKFIKYYSKEFEVEDDEENADCKNAVRVKLLKFIQEQYSMHIKDFYGVAVFLDPNFKSLKFLDFDERSALLQLVKIELKKLTVNINPPNPKKIKLKAFHEFMDISMGDDEDLINSEIQRYLGLNLEDSVDVMAFWKSTDDLPNLKKLARKTLHVPACSFFSGCCFLSLREEEKCKCNLKPEETESYTFLNHNVWSEK